MIGSKQIKKMVCIACNETIGDHSFNKLGKCLVRIQGSMMLDAQNKKEIREENNSTKGEIETLDKSNVVSPKSESNEDLLAENEISTSDGELGFKLLERKHKNGGTLSDWNLKDTI